MSLTVKDSVTGVLYAVSCHRKIKEGEYYLGSDGKVQIMGVLGLGNAYRHLLKPLPWKPSKGGLYWYIKVSGAPMTRCATYDGVVHDKACVESGNCYRTEAEAQAKLEQVLAVLKS